jgi:hypothetical protein
MVILHIASLSFLLHPIGLCAGSAHQQVLCNGYNFWSGIGSDIGEVAIIGGLITIVRHLNCHAKGCYRLGGHLVPGTPYKTCRKHHPYISTGRVSAEHIAAAADKAAQGDNPAPSPGETPAAPPGDAPAA